MTDQTMVAELVIDLAEVLDALTQADAALDRFADASDRGVAASDFSKSIERASGGIRRSRMRFLPSEAEA